MLVVCIGGERRNRDSEFLISQLVTAWAISPAVLEDFIEPFLEEGRRTVQQGGTDNPAAFDLYLRAQQLLLGASFEAGVAGYVADISGALKEFAAAIELDPHYANAHARLAICYTEIQREAIGAVRESRKAANDALAAANRAVQLAPNLGFTQAVLADILAELFYDFAGAKLEYERALELAPGDVRVLTRAPLFLAQTGQQQQALSYAQRAVALDSLDIYALSELESVLAVGRCYEESLQIARRMAQLQPAYPSGEDDIYIRSGDLASALQFCTATPIKTIYQFCAAIVYHKLNRRAEAEDIFKVYQTEAGEASAYQFAVIYSQWGDTSKALEWIETAYRLKDPGLVNLKTDALMDPVRQQPRFQAVDAGAEVSGLKGVDRDFFSRTSAGCPRKSIALRSPCCAQAQCGH
jgi:tetratricopeptide (TPR) repeat protein